MTVAAGTQQATTEQEAPSEIRSSDTRRITEGDADAQRLHAAALRRLRANVRRLAQELRASQAAPSGASAEIWHAAVQRFIHGQVENLWTIYRDAHREGVRDYYGAVSLTKRAPAVAVDEPTMKRRLAFYAPSVAKMAHEAQNAAHLAQHQALLQAQLPAADPQALSERSELSEVLQLADADPLDAWLKSLDLRLTLQANLAWSGLQDGYVAGGASDPASPFAQLWWDLEPLASHCPECLSYAAGSPYDRPGSGGNELDATPGDGHTECGAACKCSLRYGGAEATDAGYGDGWDLLLGHFTPQIPEEQQPVAAKGAKAAQGTRTDTKAPTKPTKPTKAPVMEPGASAVQPPIPEALLTDDQKRALDLLRATWNAWEEWKGDLPSLPALFAPLTQDDPWMAILIEHGGGELNWGDLTPKQQSIILQAFEALAAWSAATRAAEAAEATAATHVTDGPHGSGATQG